MNNIMRGLVERLGYLINPVFLNSSRENNQLLVFYFHGLFESPKHKELNHIDPQQNMTVDQLVQFIEYFLKHGYEFIQPEDLLYNCQENHRYIILTFDDGYFNNMLAIDIFARYKIPAVFYITIRNILENKSFWWDIIYKYRIKQGHGIAKIRKEQDSLKHLDYKSIDEYIRNNFGFDAIRPWSDIDRPLTESEVKMLAKNPYITFGNHTFNHTILINCTREEIKKEFTDANSFIIDNTGNPPFSVAFPNGYFNELTVEVAEETGFKFACTAVPRRNLLPLENRKMIFLNRFMSNPKNINNYGSFYRLGYSPGRLYSGFKRIINPFAKKPEY